MEEVEAMGVKAGGKRPSEYVVPHVERGQQKRRLTEEITDPVQRVGQRSGLSAAS
jgi:hypothetical protein